MPRKSGSRPHQRPARPGRERYSTRRGSTGTGSGRTAGRVGTPARSGCRAQRERLAYESARIIAEQGIPDLERARRKAAERIGVSDKRCWPDNSEIEQALQQQNRLFHAERQHRTLAELRSGALAAMRAFSLFDPRLVGQTVTGTATREQGVQLHLFADDPAEIVLTLLDRGIPWQERDTQFRYAGGPPQVHPVLAFVAGDIPIELVVLPHRAKRNPPLSPVTERPERGLSTREVEELINTAGEDGAADGF
jgi:hypothetical protein